MRTFLRLGLSTLAMLCSPALFPATEPDSALLASLLQKHAADPGLARVLGDPQRFDLQILWTRVNSGRVVSRESFRLDATRWFSPASTVKLPLAILALEALPALKLSRESELWVRYPEGCIPVAASAVPSPERESLSRAIRRTLIVSDNEAANRLYQWQAGDAAQSRMSELLLPDVRLIRPLMVCTDAARQRLGAVRLYPPKGRVVALPERSAGKRPPFPYGQVLRGKAWLENGVLTPGPRDFTDSNFLPLSAAEQLLMMVVRPELLAKGKRSTMRESDRIWLREVLATTPEQSPDPVYPPADYPRHYAKFFLVGDAAPWPSGVRIYNKIGEAYGYLTDVAYIENRAAKVGFFLAATLSVDLDGTLNDGQYAYEEIGYPFLAALGRVIYEHELEAATKLPTP